jgi:hypothetical protein
MKTPLLASLIIASLASVTFAASAETELRTLEDQWIDAYVKGDSAFLKTIEADDYVLVESDGNTTTKAQDVKDLTDKNFVCKAGSLSDVKVVMLGENAAYVTATLKMTATYKGKDISGDYRGVDIFENKDGKWQVHYSQLSKVKKDKE